MVHAIHVNKRLALTEQGDTVPITALFDCDGDETDDPKEAVAFTAGSDQSGWFSAPISDYCIQQTIN